MSQDTLERPDSPNGPSDGRTNYEKLLYDAQQSERAEVPPKKAYEDLTAKIVKSKDYYHKNGLTVREAMDSLHEVYVEDNPNVHLGGFAAAVIDAPKMAYYQSWIDAHPRGEGTGREEADRKEMAYGLCEYNHVMRDTILGARESMNRAELTALIDGATGHRITKFNHSVITGQSAEIAFVDALQEMPGMTDVRFADVETDFRKSTDVLARYNGKPVGYDLKFGKNIFKAGARQINGDWIQHITLGVPVEAIAELGASAEGAEKIRNSVAVAMASIA